MGLWEKLKTEDTKTPQLKDTSKMGRPLLNEEPLDKIKKVLFTKSEIEELEQYKKSINYQGSFSSFLKTLIYKGMNDGND